MGDSMNAPQPRSWQGLLSIRYLFLYGFLASYGLQALVLVYNMIATSPTKGPSDWLLLLLFLGFFASLLWCICYLRSETTAVRIALKAIFCLTAFYLFITFAPGIR